MQQKCDKNVTKMCPWVDKICTLGPKISCKLNINLQEIKNDNKVNLKPAYNLFSTIFQLARPAFFRYKMLHVAFIYNHNNLVALSINQT